MREIICNNSRYYYCNRMSIDLTRVPPPLCNQTGTHFHCYNLQKHFYVVICIFYLFHGQCLLLHGRPN